MKSEPVSKGKRVRIYYFLYRFAIFRML
jgi:hypothetical protein